MSSRPLLSIHHAIPGRLRLGIEPLRGRPVEAERLAEAVRALPGIRGARANAAAASLVVEYDPKISQDDLLARLGGVAELFRWGIHEIECAPASCPFSAGRQAPPPTTLVVLETASCANLASRVLTAGYADLKIIIPGLLAGYGLYRLFAGKPGPTPHWTVLVMQGFSAFMELNQAVIRRCTDPPPAAALRG
jgi:hypothetical protein